MEASGYVDGGTIGQRHHGADAGGRHQTSAHFVVPDDGQQATMEDDDLFAERPPNNEQRFDQPGQVGEALDQLVMRASNFTFPIIPTLRPKLRKVPRRSFSIAMAFD